MRGWVVAAVCAAGWAATCVESRRRWLEDGKALHHAREALVVGYTVASTEGLATPETIEIARASAHVNAALEARARRA